MTDDPSLPAGPLTAIFQFEVGGIYVRGDQLGDRLETDQDDRRVWIDLPGRDQVELGQPGISGSRGHPDDPGAIFRVELIEVGVALGDIDREAGQADLLRSAEPTARKVVRRLLNWARIHGGQPWLAPPHVEVPLGGASWLANAAGDRSRGLGRIRVAVAVFSDEDAPSGDLSASLIAREFEESASLLAEARWAIWPERDGDSKRAVLMAAIALEVKASETLLAMADERTRPLVELLLSDEPSINRMLNKIAAVVGGESLREYDGRLAKTVSELVDLRNDVVHRGKTPKDDDAVKAVRAAEDAFAWLEAKAATPRAQEPDRLQNTDSQSSG